MGRLLGYALVVIGPDADHFLLGYGDFNRQVDAA
jgi:hypothetical protein